MNFEKVKSYHILFFAILFVKIVLGSVLASKVLTDLFIPFLDYFVETFSNPYDKFLNIGPKDHFPYPTLMLYIMSLPKILFGWIAPENPFFKLFLYRLPLLMADIAIFLILKEWLKGQLTSRLIWLYWLSPVLIYISYIHGQLDVIPIALLFMSLYFLFKDRIPSFKKINLSALLLGFSLATKTHIALVYPFFFLFLISKGVPLKHLIVFAAVSFGTFFIVNAPYIFDPSFIEMVFQNRGQEKLFNAIFQLDGLPIYIIPCLMLLLFIRGIWIKSYNRDIFMMFLGFNFSLVLLFIPPMPGWYFWLIPFLAYFYIRAENEASHLLFFGLQGFYILYFMVSKNADYLEVFQLISPEIMTEPTFYTLLSNVGINSNAVVGVVFTGLQTILLINCVFIYRKGLDSYTKHKLTSSPFLVGIGGDSAVGKSTLADTLLNIFTPLNATVLRGDDMHKWQRGDEKWNEFTHLNPKANQLHKEIHFLKKLKAGHKISRRKYDHNTGQFTKEATISPKNLTVFEGLHPFYLTSQARLYDLKIFVKPTTDLVHHWKIVRDRQERGYSKEKILQSLKQREHDSKKYIQTQIDKADIVIEPIPVEKIQNIGDKEEKLDVYYKILLSNDVYIEPIIEALQNIETLHITHEYTEEAYQSVILKGHCPLKEIKKIGSHYIKGLEGLGLTIPSELKDSFGVLMLLVTYYIFEKADNEKE